MTVSTTAVQYISIFYQMVLRDKEMTDKFIEKFNRIRTINLQNFAGSMNKFDSTMTVIVSADFDKHGEIIYANK
jgi:5S rRNA maturation endonuclease (ribonuclease M5)